jgi:hypothetical protein
MKRIVRPLLVILSLIAPTVTLASVTYTFDFTDINSQDLLQPNPKPDFSLTLTYPGFVTTTGLNAIEGGPLSTTLGYSVTSAGTNSLGWWGFADNNSAFLTDTGFGYVGGSFLFQPSTVNSYFTAPGSFVGYVMGNDPSSFDADATLTITETGVPEPSTVWLFTAGLVAIAVSRRRKMKGAGAANPEASTQFSMP